MPSQKPATASTYALVLLLAIVASIISIQTLGDLTSPDLKALWIAGEFYADGKFNQVYPNDTTHFTMTPPSEWANYLREQGHTGDVFPYIYAPIWAAFAAKLSAFFTFSQVLSIATVINPMFIAGMVFLAWRIGEKYVSAPVFTTVGLAFIMGTSSGMIALFQNQPQILVSFLIVLGIERSLNGNSRTAGAVLGLAAALKLYPVIFALFLFARGDRRSLTSFALVGGSLGVLSILLTGWPLHALFLHQISTISAGALVTPLSYSLDATIANLFFQDAMEFIPATSFKSGPDGTIVAANIPGSGWTAVTKTPGWKLFSTGLFFGVILFLCLVIRRSPRDAAIWPFAITLLALVSPLSWVYHYLPALAFSPMLLGRLETKKAAYILLFFFATNMLGVLQYYSLLPIEINMIQFVGTMLMAGYCALWGYILIKHPRDTP